MGKNKKNSLGLSQNDENIGERQPRSYIGKRIAERKGRIVML